MPRTTRLLLLLLLLAFVYTSAGAQAPAYDAQRVQFTCNWFDSTAYFGAGETKFNDVWGFEWKGMEYAAIGSQKGMSIIDVATCQRVAFKEAPNSHPFILHRDYKTYKNYLYAVSDEGVSGLLVYDFSYLPDSVHLVYTGSFDTLTTAHNIFIDTTSGRLYAGMVRSRTLGTPGMQVYSLANPEVPKLTHNLAPHNSPLKSRAHDVFVRRDTAYMSCENGGYFVGTFDQNNDFKLIGDLTVYPNQGYNHSSWINEKNIGIMADESPVPLKVIQLNYLPQISIKSEFSPCTGDTYIPHNPFLIEDIAYISHYKQGLQIYNIIDPANPVRVGYFDTYPDTSINPYLGAWGCYPYLKSKKVLVSDIQRGLFVLDASEAVAFANNPSAVAAVATGEIALQLFPNPATTSIQVQGLPPVTGTYEIEIWEGATGRQMGKPAFRVATNGSLSVPLPASLPAGLYLLRATAGGNSYTASFLKQN
jgi:choice-of-anchor B domain-containing protein